MKDHRLDGQSFGVQFGNGGTVEIIGAGDNNRLVAVPGAEEYPIEVHVSPAWPSIYFRTRREAIEFAHPRGGTFVEHTDKLTLVRWFVGTEPGLAFPDLADVMLYAQASWFGRE